MADQTASNLDNFEGMMTGIVMDNVDSTNAGRVFVYIPKMMSDITQGKREVHKEAVNASFANPDLKPANQATSSNGLWVKPLQEISGEKNQGEYKIPKIGTAVQVFFLDGNTQNGYYSRQTPSLEADVLTCDTPTPGNFSDSSKRVNVDVIRCYSDGTVIVVDNNAEGTVVFIKTGKGQYIRMDDTNKTTTIFGGDATIKMEGGNIRLNP